MLNFYNGETSTLTHNIQFNAVEGVHKFWTETSYY